MTRSAQKAIAGGIFLAVTAALGYFAALGFLKGDYGTGAAGAILAGLNLLALVFDDAAWTRRKP